METILRELAKEPAIEKETKRAIEMAIDGAIEKEEDIGTVLKREFPNIAVPILISPYWTEGYLLLDLPAISAADDRVHNFLSKIRNICSCLEDIGNKEVLFHLESIILNNLSNDQNQREWCVIDISKIISGEKASVVPTLIMISAGGKMKMAERNWVEAVKIFSRIKIFPKEVLEQFENMELTADIFRDLGISKIRGDDAIEGEKDLLTAEDYYLRKKRIS